MRSGTRAHAACLPEPGQVKRRPAERALRGRRPGALSSVLFGLCPLVQTDRTAVLAGAPSGSGPENHWGASSPQGRSPGCPQPPRRERTMLYENPSATLKILKGSLR